MYVISGGVTRDTGVRTRRVYGKGLGTQERGRVHVGEGARGERDAKHLVRRRFALPEPFPAEMGF